MENLRDRESAGMPRSVHTFHIPVMGTGFSIDTALRVAKYGISSVLSLVDDTLVEQMRQFHSERAGEAYEPITNKDPDARARRITAYLNLLDRLIKRQVEALQSSAFKPGSEITRYYDLLPDSELKQYYADMLATEDSQEKEQRQQELRRRAVPGSIDANIMTTLDSELYINGVKQPREFSDAMSALRGFANSTLQSSMVLSAGMNPRLYTYLSKFEDFFPDETGFIKKKIILKVSDYRSALIQGKFLAKRGIWVSEYRIESGLNCGGHAFATKGELMGPILEEFKDNRTALVGKLHPVYVKALRAGGRTPLEKPGEVLVTVQGGIGTAGENGFLFKYYGVDSTGWGTPFLLVPEVANVDEEHLEMLAAATIDDVELSNGSPLGILYWNLRNSASERTRRRRIAEGKPGAPCPKSHAVTNTEFTDIPICTSSRAYQKQKLEHLDKEGWSETQLKVVKEDILAKACICHELGGSVKIINGIEPDAQPTICCGPGIADFSKIASLEEMVSHIYGRISLITNVNRSHMFIQELKIYIENLRKELERYSLGLSARTPVYLREFKDNLLEGIEYYRRLGKQYIREQKTRFLDDLNRLQEELQDLPSAVLVSSGS